MEHRHALRQPDRSTRRPVLPAVFVLLAVVVVLLAASGRPLALGDDNGDNRSRTNIQAVPGSLETSVVVPTGAATPYRGSSPSPAATPSAVAEPPQHPDGNEGVAANELGRIPILMYHGFVLEDASTDEWTITLDQFRAQLDWLRANDFVLVGMNSVIEREFAIPAGKRPAILTLDDGLSSQFGLQPAGGGYEVRPDTAVSVLEEYREQDPGFVTSAFFAVPPSTCFGSEDDPATCEERLAWLIDHGYEIGNHTMTHVNLTDVSVDDFVAEVGGPVHWFADRFTGENVLGDVVVLPYGAYPASSELMAWLFDGFWTEGEAFVPTLVVEVGGGPARSPFHREWTTNVPRYNASPEGFWYWAEQFSTGEMVVFVSDGDPDTVTIPAGWEEVLDETLVQEDGRRLVILSP